jgi:hypothetical protein
MFWNQFIAGRHDIRIVCVVRSLMINNCVQSSVISGSVSSTELCLCGRCLFLANWIYNNLVSAHKQLCVCTDAFINKWTCLQLIWVCSAECTTQQPLRNESAASAILRKFCFMNGYLATESCDVAY